MTRKEEGLLNCQLVESLSLSLSALVLLVSGDRLIEIVRILVIKKYPGQGGG